MKKSRLGNVTYWNDNKWIIGWKHILNHDAGQSGCLELLRESGGNEKSEQRAPLLQPHTAGYCTVIALSQLFTTGSSGSHKNIPLRMLNDSAISGIAWEQQAHCPTQSFSAANDPFFMPLCREKTAGQGFKRWIGCFMWCPSLSVCRTKILLHVSHSLKWKGISRDRVWQSLSVLRSKSIG